MQRLRQRTYVGTPGETATVTMQIDGGGQAAVTVDGQPLVNGEFQLPSTPGASARMVVSLAGQQGATCIVTIRVVDGAFDNDLLVCAVFNPAPVGIYDFTTIANASLTAFAAAAEGGPQLPRPTKRRRSAAPTGGSRKKGSGKGKRGGK